MVEKLCWRTDVVSRRPRDCQRYVAERERGADCFSQWSKRVVLDGGCHDGNPLRVTVCEQYHPHLSAALAILLQALPQFVLTIVIGLIDGLVRRDLRRFGAGHESGFVYHHARRMIGSSLAATGLAWLAVPVFLKPSYMLVPSAVITALSVSLVLGAFKKYI